MVPPVLLEIGKFLLTTFVESVVGSLVRRVIEPPVQVSLDWSQSNARPRSSNAVSPRLGIVSELDPLEKIVIEANVRLELERKIRSDEAHLTVYPLPGIGYLRSRLPNDKLPAIFLSDIYWGPNGEQPWINIWKPLHDLCISFDRLGLCHDCSVSWPQKNGYAALAHHIQAADLCAHEFPDRPAIIVFHSGDATTVDTYAVIWGFDPTRPRTIQFVHLARVMKARAETDFQKELMQLQNAAGEVHGDNASIWESAAIPFSHSSMARRLFALPFLTIIGGLLDAYKVSIYKSGFVLGSLLRDAAEALSFEATEIEDIEANYYRVMDSAFSSPYLKIERVAQVLRGAAFSATLHKVQDLCYVSAILDAGAQVSAIVTFDLNRASAVPSVFLWRSGAVEEVKIEISREDFGIEMLPMILAAIRNAN